MKNRSEKAALIAQIQEAAGRASFAVVTDFKGMSVEELTGLRVALRAAGGEYHVVKNTLARIALADTAHSPVAPALKNNSAIALGFQDPVGELSQEACRAAPALRQGAFDHNRDPRGQDRGGSGLHLALRLSYRIPQGLWLHALRIQRAKFSRIV